MKSILCGILAVCLVVVTCVTAEWLFGTITTIPEALDRLIDLGIYCSLAVTLFGVFCWKPTEHQEEAYEDDTTVRVERAAESNPTIGELTIWLNQGLNSEESNVLGLIWALIYGDDKLGVNDYRNNVRQHWYRGDLDRLLKVRETFLTRAWKQDGFLAGRESDILFGLPIEQLLGTRTIFDRRVEALMTKIIDIQVTETN